MEKLRILILFGGASSEHGVSLQSAQAVLSNLDSRRFEAVPVGITREGQWLYLERPDPDLAARRWEAAGIPCTLDLNRGSRRLVLLDGSGRGIPADAAFPVLHGKNGEDGTVQGACDLAGLPLVGCGTFASAACMDKDRAHRLAAAAGIRIPESVRFGRQDGLPAIRSAAETLGYPLFVKPVRAGSSFGVSRPSQPEQLENAVREAFAHDSEILLEEAVSGFEVGCAVMGSRSLTVGTVDEIELAGGFFDYGEKYTLKSARIHCPARIPAAKAQEIQHAAKTVYRALGCRVMARVDFFLTADGAVLFNEVNTLPGFTEHSRFPSMMRGIGLSFRELLTRLIELGVQP